MSVSEEVLAEVTRILAEGAKWVDKCILLYNAIEAFQDPSEQLVRTRKGNHPSVLQQPWQELAVIVQRYITCDDRHDGKALTTKTSSHFKAKNFS